MSFGSRVTAVVGQTGPLCIGVDPSAELLARWWLTDDAGGLRAFCANVLDAAVGVVGLVKPQVAFFERHGAAGMAVLEDLIGRAREQRLLVIADAKRGDIGSTASAYGQAWLEEGRPLCVDAVTVSAYLGFRALQPMIDVGRTNGNGVIVIARSSNPEGQTLQDATTPGGDNVAEHLLRQAALSNAQETGDEHLGTVGAVMGATVAPDAASLLGRLGGVVLAPGFGAQGAQAPDLDRVFARCPTGSVVASVSRAILQTGPSPAAMRAAAEQWQSSLRQTRVGGHVAAETPNGGTHPRGPEAAAAPGPTRTGAAPVPASGEGVT